MRRSIGKMGLLGPAIAVLTITLGASAAAGADSEEARDVIRHAWQMQTIYLPSTCGDEHRTDPDDRQIMSERSTCPPR